MKITWVTRSFLDYRIPLYAELAKMPDVEFTLLTSGEDFCTPARVREKARQELGDRIHFLTGEKRIGKPYSADAPSNSYFRICFQPGLTKEIKKTNPEVVITDAFNHWTLPVLRLRGGGHFKHIVCYERTVWTERHAGFLKRCFIKLAGRRIDAVHCNGVLCQEFLRSLGYPDYKLKPGNMTCGVAELAVKSAAVTPEMVSALRQKFALASGVTFLFVGRLTRRKGVTELLNAFKIHAEKYPEDQLLLVGAGPQEAELRQYCDENGLPQVKFCGSCINDEIHTFYRLADVFILPTLEDNWSLVVPEAMACGLPVATSIYNGCHPELVKPENGWTFDPLRQESIGQCLEEIHQKKADLPAMGEASRRLVADFAPEKIAGQIYRTCRELAAAEA